MEPETQTGAGLELETLEASFQLITPRADRLLVVMAEIIGDSWTEHTHEAWSHALDDICVIMLAANTSEAQSGC